MSATTTKTHALDIEGLWRRGPGQRQLVYLDQSTRSLLVAGDAPKLLKVLRAGIHQGHLVCPVSYQHEEESVLAERSHRVLQELGDELSMGVEFLDDREIERNEIRSAVAAFLGQPAPMAPWQEAFNKDPHSPMQELFPVGGMRVSVMTDRVDWAIEEAEQDKSHVQALTSIFEAVRASGLSFQEQSEQEFRSALEWQGLRTLFFPLKHREREATLWQHHQDDLMRGNDVMRVGSPFNQYLHAKHQADFAVDLCQRYPELRAQRQAFYESPHVRAIPMFRYPALLVAGLETTTGRKAKLGDVYDISHLTQGLSRCDVVTADGGMVQLCRDRKLIPAGVALFPSRDLDGLTRHLETPPHGRS